MRQQRRSDEMTRDHGAGRRPSGAAGGWKASLAGVLKDATARDTKGGRDRVEPIRTPEQRALLDLSCVTRSSSTSDPQRNLAQRKTHASMPVTLSKMLGHALQ